MHLDNLFNEDILEMNMVNKQITITWNTKGLPMEQSNGHYPNETETVTVLSEDDKTFYCSNSVEVYKDME